jgi:MFS transporter, DHA2 family, methylenomycin A resistance protein
VRRRTNIGLLAVLIAAQVLGVANANLIAVALPPLSADLGASGTQQQWIVDAYVLVFAALLVAGGVLGDRYGRRRALLAGLALFALGSLVCALAPSPAAVIAARVVQGLGPPLILPASLAILAAASPEPRRRARAIGLWGAGSGVGVAVGPLLGGVLVSGLGWRWAFLFNVPAALALAAAALALVPRDRPAAAAYRFDVAGALLVTLGLAALVFGIIEGRERGWASAEVLGSFAAAIALGAAFVRSERRHPEPLVDLGLLGRRAFALANLAGATMLFALLGTTVYLSAFLQDIRGLSALATGAALLPLGAAVAVVAPAAGRLSDRVPARALLAGGLACAAAGALLLARVDAGTGPGALWPGLLLLGAGVGAALPAATATALAAVPRARTGMASAIHNATRQVGATLGVAVLGTIVLAHGDVAEGLPAAMRVAAAVLAAAALLTLAPARPAPP